MATSVHNGIAQRKLSVTSHIMLKSIPDPSATYLKLSLNYFYATLLQISQNVAFNCIWNAAAFLNPVTIHMQDDLFCNFCQNLT